MSLRLTESNISTVLCMPNPTQAHGRRLALLHPQPPEMRKCPGAAERAPKVLVGITGSVAAVKGPEIAVRLATSANLHADVRVLLTQGGLSFWGKAETYNKVMWEQMTSLRQPQKNHDHQAGTISIYSAESEWEEWNEMGDPVLHIELRDWADIFIVCPLSAHSLAKLANGLCDDTLSCVARAWDFGHGSRPGKPLVLAPAMNTAMWVHPLTQTHMETVLGFWNSVRDPRNAIRIVTPQVKTLACGEVGNGALASVDDIITQVERSLKECYELKSESSQLDPQDLVKPC